VVGATRGNDVRGICWVRGRPKRLTHGREEQKKVLEEEDQYRRRFASDRFIFTSTVHLNHFLACMNVWQHMDRFHYQPEDPEEVTLTIQRTFWAHKKGRRESPRSSATFARSERARPSSAERSSLKDGRPSHLGSSTEWTGAMCMLRGALC
jgi:hypothetical protein